jgi:hypothetical protein
MIMYSNPFQAQPPAKPKPLLPTPGQERPALGTRGPSVTPAVIETKLKPQRVLADAVGRQGKQMLGAPSLFRPPPPLGASTSKPRNAAGQGTKLGEIVRGAGQTRLLASDGVPFPRATLDNIQRRFDCSQPLPGTPPPPQVHPQTPIRADQVPLPPRKPVLPEQPRVFEDHLPSSEIRSGYRQATAWRETRGEPFDGYYTDRDDSALGRYQFQEITLKQLGLVRRDGTWNENNCLGVRTREDFVHDRQAQEVAMEMYTIDNERQLRTIDNPPVNHIGQRIDGTKQTFYITMGGLLAAAHRHGPGAVRKYLNFMERNGWVADYSSLDTGNEQDQKDLREYIDIETRMREFENIPARGDGRREE